MGFGITGDNIRRAEKETKNMKQYTREELIQRMSGEKASKICIFGAGGRGLELEMHLEITREKADFFCDNDKEKQGTLIQGIPCLSFEELEKEKEDTLVIVSPEEGESILAQLKEAGFPHVRSRKEINVYATFVRNIELNVVNHCDLDCRYCAHFSCVAPEYVVPLETLEHDVCALSKILGDSLGTLKVIGGEPLLHPHLEKIFVFARKYFPISQIWLVTNGVRLLSQAESFWQTCKEQNITIVVTKYPVNLKFDKMEELALAYGIPFRFTNGRGVVKTMYKFPIDVEGNCDPKVSFDHCHLGENCPMVMEGKFYPCPVVANIAIFNEKFQQNVPVTQDDFIDLESNPSLEEITAFRSKPFPFCKHCNITGIVTDLKWERTKGNMEDWLA